MNKKPAESRPDWFTEDVDLERPSAARVYDYLLGGYHNFAVDRLIAEKTRELYPDVALAAQVNRAFLRRSVNFLIDQGVTQFVDIGSGIPTVGHVHEILEARGIEGTVFYIDIDPIAVAHSKAILKDNPRVVAFQEDVRHPEAIFTWIEESGPWDCTQPAAILFMGLLHFVLDVDQTRRLVEAYRRALAPGSFIAFTIGTYEGIPENIADGIARLSEATTTKSRYRSKEEILSIFQGFDFVDPGIVYVPLWRPESPEDLFLEQPERSLAFAGVARTE